jgi:dolichyl-phosphate-mannose-protein mannosyltransferase
MASFTSSSIPKGPPKLELSCGEISPSVIVLVSVIAVLATLFLIWPVWRALLPLQVLRSEGFNAYHADTAMSAPGLLYLPPDGLVANNYPPLYEFLTGGLARLFGDALYVGRAISLLATVGLGIAAASIVRQFGGGRTAAILAAAWFVATMARFYDDYVGMNDPQLLAHLIMAAGLVWFISRYRAERSVEPAVLVMVVAGFFKQNVAAIPVAALVWLALDDWRKGLRATLFGAIATAAGLAICAWLWKPNFIGDLLLPRTYPLDRALSFVRATNLWLHALVLWALWAWLERQSTAARFTMLHVGASFVLFVLQRSAQGVGSNGQFDLVFALAIGIGLAFDRLPLLVGWKWQPARIRLVMLAILLARLVASPRMEFAYVLLSPDYRALAANYSAVARAEAVRLAAIPHPIACFNLVICRMAGKAFVFDHFKVSQMVATGAYSWDNIAAMTRAQGISFEAVDPRARASSLFRRCPTINETWYYSLKGRATVSRPKGHERGFTLDCEYREEGRQTPIN